MITEVALKDARGVVGRTVERRDKEGGGGEVKDIVVLCGRDGRGRGGVQGGGLLQRLCIEVASV